MFTFFRSIWSSPSSMSSAPSSSPLSPWLLLLLRQVWSLLDLCRPSHSILLGIGCAIIFTGVPVYFIIVSDDYVKKPESVRRFLGEEDLEKPSVHFHPFSMMRSFPFLSTCVLLLIPLISPNPAASETIWLQKLFLAVATDKTDWNRPDLHDCTFTKVWPILAQL